MRRGAAGKQIMLEDKNTGQKIVPDNTSIIAKKDRLKHRSLSRSKAYNLISTRPKKQKSFKTTQVSGGPTKLALTVDTNDTIAISSSDTKITTNNLVDDSIKSQEVNIEQEIQPSPTFLSISKDKSKDTRKVITKALSTNRITQTTTNLGYVAISNDINLPAYSLWAKLSKNSVVPHIKFPSTGVFNKHVHGKKHHILVGISILAVILASISLISIGNSKPKGGTLDNNVIIGGLDVSKQYPAEAKKNLLIASQKQKISIEVAGKTIQANAKDIGLSRDIDSAISQAESSRKTIAQKTVLKDTSPTIIPIKSSINQKTLDKFIAEKLGSDMVPANAELKIDNGNLTIIPGKNGIAINSVSLSNQLNQIGLSPTVNIKAPSSQVPPNISTEAAQTANAKAESLIAPNFVVGNDAVGFKTIPKSQKVSWLTISPDPDKKNINIAINIEAAKKSFEGTVASFNKKAEETTQVNIPGGSTIVLEEGIDGVNIPTQEISAASSKFSSLINAGQGGTLNINSNTIPAGVRALNGSTSGKMILVDVPNFKAYAIENGNIVNQTLVSTGQRGGETPSGVFAVRSKVKNITMKGCSPAFGCWSVPNVPNVMTFDSRGDALHGAYWHNSFGKANLSHGCVNLPLGFADWLFDWTPVGTPVVVVR
jgi:hypothetical protein